MTWPFVNGHVLPPFLLYEFFGVSLRFYVSYGLSEGVGMRSAHGWHRTTSFQRT